MNPEDIKNFYDFHDKVVAVTGGAGVLGSELVLALAACGAKVVILDLDVKPADRLLNQIKDLDGEAITVQTDVLKPDVLENSLKHILDAFGKVDSLINAAGGNHPKATTSPETSFFNLVPEAMRFVFDLNLIGTILPSQVFGKHMAEKGEGNILNVSSMSAYQPLTRVVAYSAAKAGVNSFTQWLAVHMAQEYSPNIRVNAIAPGFFLTRQNRFLLTDEKSGELTDRGKTIIQHTPMRRFGKPEDLIGVTLWLLSPASAFVSGAVIPVDGGFAAFSGV